MIECKLKKELSAAEGKMILNVDFRLNEGDFVVLYGNSGAGKTSILRMLSGLLRPEDGYINQDSNVWFNAEKKIDIPIQKRKIGLVFQDYALFPNMNVEENIYFSLPQKKDKKTAEELIELMELGNLRKQKIQQLSGGQQQRVALARALARKPKLLLLDEPLSALDHGMRTKLQEYILKLHKTYNLTTILVSHDPAEIIKMANKVLVLENGKFTKTGTPISIFSESKLSGKFQFTGEVLAKIDEEVVSILHILIGNNVIKSVSAKDEIAHIQKGDKVLVASKAFNPIVTKIE
ncbi:ABC transporter ATP-binding protein [Zunongwangia atlantica]|uniref:Molybdenum transport atp-binding protein n=1 Tax=Zunongwangia atlantica 22II14-10F7 TaxID=1185767 RepID=A0A1Y1SZX6_9FLAO|nr:ATP-binding cassette domain-containing protein [Zunongwangia atlantica]ORL44112.1 molybdenum transport atp-binding protein [Zunongwangia atlantica 22II14-10F7]